MVRCRTAEAQAVRGEETCLTGLSCVVKAPIRSIMPVYYNARSVGLLPLLSVTPPAAISLPIMLSTDFLSLSPALYPVLGAACRAVHHG